jgi:F0F1-type ATP synthase delta subunit
VPADITKYFTSLDASAPAAAKAELPSTLSKLTGRSGDLTRELFAAGAKGKNFDKIVKDLEGFVAAVEKAGMVVDRFFTTPNYSEAECRKVVELLLTAKEPLASFASIKDAEVKDVIVDNEANVATWLAARKAVAALQLSEPVAAAISKMAAEGNLLRVKLVARKAAEVRATTAKSLDVVVSSAVALSRAQQEAVTKALPAYVQAGAGQTLAPVFVVDPAVMGGLLVSFKNLSIDLSASTRLVEVAAAHAKLA